MRSADISLLIIIQMYSKWKHVHTTNCVYYFFNIDFQRSKGGSTFYENNLNFRYVSSGVYSMTKCGNSEIKAVYNYKNDNFVITRVRQNVTGESTPSGLLTS